MKKRRFTDEQIVRLLQEAERKAQSIGELCRQHGCSEAAFYRWRVQFGGLAVPEVRRLRELEQENARLKRLLAERDLELDAMQEVLEKKPHAPGSGAKR